MASVTNYRGNPNDLMEQTHSGLFNYLFGKDRKKEINREMPMAAGGDAFRGVDPVECVNAKQRSRPIRGKKQQ